MAESQLPLTPEERECLTLLLQEALKNTLVEEHRTRAPSYREHVVRREEIIRSVLKKLETPAD